MATLDFNYEDSLSLILKNELKLLGYDVSALNGFRGILKAYYTVRLRLVEKQKRKVYINSSLKCPPTLIKGLTCLEQKFIRGENVNPHLSKEIRNLDYVDGMLFDWGIYHFHLGTKLDNRGLIERTGNVLYAMVMPNEVYFIMIAPHGQWACKDLLEIVNTEWPLVLNNFKLSNCVSMAYKPSESDIKEARKGRLVMPVELSDGTVLIPPGMGMNADGSSIKVMREVASLCDCLRKEENDMKKTLKDICDTLDPKHSLDLANEHFHFRCRRNGNQIVIEDPKHDVSWHKVIALAPLKELFLE